MGSERRAVTSVCAVLAMTSAALAQGLEYCQKNGSSMCGDAGAPQVRIASQTFALPSSGSTTVTVEIP